MLQKDNSILCGFRKYPYSSHGGSLETSEREGVSKANIFTGYEATLNVPEGCGEGA